MRRAILPSIAAAFLLLVAMIPASAGQPFTQATGGIWLSGPTQYVSFNAFDYGDSGDRGTFNYANFTYAAPGSGAWLPVAGTYTLTVSLGASDYVHTMTVDAVHVISPHKSTFSGTGFYNADPSYTWDMTGSIVGSTIAFHILYTGTNAGYTFDGVGSADTMSGTGTDSALNSPLTWSLPSSFAHEILSYTADVTCAVVSSPDATFGFTIPAGFPGLSGQHIVVNVHDGGTPGTNGDTYGHGVGTCGDGVTNYPITAGNLVVH
jgi:hypothetical protein